jgi:hypothetical protein
VGEELSFTRKTGIHPVAGGAAGLVYPLLLISVALTGGFRQGGDIADPATSILGAFLFLIAAPTAWVFAIEFIEADRFTVLFVGAMTSLPLWWLLGSRLARTAEDWRQWTVRYLRISVGWSVLVLLAVILVAGWQ